ncbi:hypothetical protein SO802_013080 [Lithocarpus litseifolius]|uniref:Uncharacterized protein n=1 Tax=Lithocarpus litseifolius TaxID=425828 RepID=A0AAW2D5H9_9ROSI
MGVSTDSEDSMDWHLWEQVYDSDHGNIYLESTEMEVERDELNEELEKGDMQMEYIRIEMELEIDELNEELKERDKQIEDIKDFIRDFLLVKKNQKVAQYWQEQSIPTEVELQDQVIRGLSFAPMVTPSARSSHLLNQCGWHLNLPPKFFNLIDLVISSIIRLHVRRLKVAARMKSETEISAEKFQVDQECNEGPLYSHLVFSGVDFDIVRHSHTYSDLDRRLKLSDEDLEDLELGTNLICSSLSSALTFEVDQRIEIRDKDACCMQEVCSRFIRLQFGQFGQVETRLLHIKIYCASFCCKIYGVDYFVTQTNSNIAILTDTLNNLQILKIVMALPMTYIPFILLNKLMIRFARPTSLDALFIGHALFVLHVVSEESVLHEMLFEHPNLVNHATVHGHEVMAVRPQSMSEILSRIPNGSYRIRKQKGKIVLWQWWKFVGFGSASVTSAKLMLTVADIVQDGFRFHEMGEIEMVLGLLCGSLFF